MSTQPTAPDQFRIGLIFRLGSRSWFWGRGAAPAIQRREHVITAKQARLFQEERWPGLAEWLRQMHATDHLSLDPATVAPQEPQPTARSDAPAPVSTATKRIRFVCNRRAIGLLIN